MLDHISLGVTDLERSRRFYDAALHRWVLSEPWIFRGEGQTTGLWPASLGWNSRLRSQPTCSRLPGMHLCFRAPNRASVREFHRAALSAGGHDDGVPGLRLQYHPDYYAAFVVDPDGHRIEAVCHAPEKAMIV